MRLLALAHEKFATFYMLRTRTPITKGHVQVVCVLCFGGMCNLTDTEPEQHAQSFVPSWVTPSKPSSADRGKWDQLANFCQVFEVVSATVWFSEYSNKACVKKNNLPIPFGSSKIIWNQSNPLKPVSGRRVCFGDLLWSSSTFHYVLELKLAHLRRALRSLRLQDHGCQRKVVICERQHSRLLARCLVTFWVEKYWQRDWSEKSGNRKNKTLIAIMLILLLILTKAVVLNIWNRIKSLTEY